jgi:hypothetical protein
MPRFSFPAFLITDLLALRRDAGRRVALMDGVVAGASGSVMLGVILGTLAKPRRPRSSGVSLSAALSATTEGQTVVNLAWTTMPGTGITYNVNRTDPGEASSEAVATALTGNTCTDDNDGDSFDSGTYTYSVDVFSGTTKITSSNQVNVSIRSSK